MAKSNMRSAKEIISLATIRDSDDGGSVIRLDVDVSPKEYAEFKKIVEHCGGLYKGKAIGHIFNTSADKTLPSIMSYVDRLDKGLKINKEEFFPTPASVATDLINQAIPEESYVRYMLSEGSNKSEMRVLEPSAGDGALIESFLKEIPGFEGTIVLMEIDPLRVETLRQKFEDDSRIQIIEGDFTSFDADTLGQFEVILMNPPFKLWEEHYKHAKSLLLDSPDAYLGVILPNMKDKIPSSPVVQELYSKANTFCCDITDVESGAFNKHDKKRGSLNKTGVSTVIMTECGNSDNKVPYLKTGNLILDTSCHRFNEIVYSEATRLSDISEDNGLSSRNILSSVALIEDYLKKNKKSLILDYFVPLPNDEIIKGLAFQQLLRHSDEFPAVFTAVNDEYRKILKPHTIERTLRMGGTLGTPEEALKDASDFLKDRFETVLYNSHKSSSNDHVTVSFTVDAFNEEDALLTIEEKGPVGGTFSYSQDGKVLATWTPSKEDEPKKASPVTARQQEMLF